MGDLHVENFGTWRDVEEHPIWGVNDFDETHPMAYANDLVRLAVSAHLAAEAGHLPLKHKDICDSLIEGYQESLRSGGMPFVLGEHHEWLREIAESELRDPVHFWAKMDALPTVKGDVPVSAIDALEHLMPARDLLYRLARRVAGLGSLGHARYVAIADWHGGKIAREAESFSFLRLLLGEGSPRPSRDSLSGDYQPGGAMSRPVRSVARTLDRAPALSALLPHRIGLASGAGQGIALACAMGWETANIHLGTRTARKPILNHMQKQKPRWLHQAAKEDGQRRPRGLEDVEKGWI